MMGVKTHIRLMMSRFMSSDLSHDLETTMRGVLVAAENQHGARLPQKAGFVLGFLSFTSLLLVLNISS